MAQIPENSRTLIIQYRFTENLSYSDIASRIPGVTADGAKSFCLRTRKRAGSDDIRELFAHSSPKPRSGGPRRIEPGSQASIRIWQAVRDPLQHHNQVEAANIACERCRQGHTTTHRKPLGELDAKQVLNILHGAAHCDADPIDSRPIMRNKGGTIRNQQICWRTS